MLHPGTFEERLRHLGEHISALAAWKAESGAGEVAAREIIESIEEISAQRELEREYAEILEERERLRSAHADAQRRAAEVVRLNEELERRVRERTAELERANATKDEFLGLISHELKTPIAVIIGFSEVLLKRADRLSDAQRRDALIDIHTEAERVHHIIDNLLTLSRLERGQQVNREPVHLPRLIARCIQEHAAQFPHRLFVVEAPPDLPYVEAAPVYVEQVLRNFISNAEKYSPADTAIELRAWADGWEVVVAVDDHGTGIPAEELEKIFTPFYRSPTTQRQAEGAGIGLAVCKRLMEAQDGRVSAERLARGGMRFAFALPITADAPA